MTKRKIIAAALASGLAGFAGLAQATDVFRLEGFGASSRAMGGTAAAHDVGADDAPAPAQRPGQRIEVAPLARQAVHADQHRRVGGRAGPLPVGHAVQAGGVQTVDEAQRGLGHGSIL